MFSVEETEESADSATDKLIAKFNECISRNPSDTLCDDETRDVFNYMRNQSQIMVAKTTLDPWLANVVDSEQFIAYFRKYLQLICCTKEKNYLHSPKNRAVANLIKLHMLVWNVSDRLESFAFKLVSAEIHFHLIQLLRKPELHPSVCYIEQNARLLVHSSIGILHNIINHIPQTRGVYRTVDAVRALTAFVTGSDLNEMQLSDQNSSPVDNSSAIRYLSLRTAALLLLAFLVDENESATLYAHEYNVIYLLTALKDALHYPPTYYSRIYGYRAIELLQGLQHLAGPDSNKRLLIRYDAMKTIETSLNEAVKLKYPCNPANCSDETSESAASPDSLAISTLEFLWALSFVEEGHQTLAPGTSFRRLFDRFATERNWSKDCQRVAQGILWTLNTSAGGLTRKNQLSIEEMMARDRRTNKPFGHLMISYQHSTQPIMLRVRDELRKRGYKVWMDVDNMRGCFVDAMAGAIQDAAALVLGVSQSFKNSPHCRQEVRYAYMLNVPLFPLQLEPDFTPDGWLGLVLATIIYVPLTDESMIENAMDQLALQLGNTGRCSPPESRTHVDLPAGYLMTSDRYPGVTRAKHSPSITTGSAGASLIQASESTTHLNAPCDVSYRVGSQPAAQTSCLNELTVVSPNPLLSSNTSHLRQLYGTLATWTPQDVTNWLTENGLSAYCDALSDLDGPLLAELARLRLVAPESLAFNLRRDLNMGFMDQLKLHRALASLALQ